MTLNKGQLIKEMENYFGSDEKRINHAKKVTEFAKQILSKEEGNHDVVLAAAVLHDIGIHEAERKHGSPGGKYQEIEGPPIAKEILKKINVSEQSVDEICEIIAHHHSPGKVNTNNFKILYDADWLVNLGDEMDLNDKDKISKAIDKIFLTQTGKELAKSIYLT